MTRTRFVTIGRILKPHGVHGEAKVEPLTSDFDRFALLQRVQAVGPGGQRQELEIQKARPFSGGLLLKFTGIDAPEPLVPFAGWHLEIPREEAIEPPAGQTLFADMIGLEARNAITGEAIGRVESIVSAGTDWIEIATPEGKVLVPWVSAFVGTVDLDAGTVQIHPIPGLLDPGSD